MHVYLVEGDSAFPMSPDVWRMNVLENSRERTAGSVWARAALTCRHISPCRNIQILFYRESRTGSNNNCATTVFELQRIRLYLSLLDNSDDMHEQQWDLHTFSTNVKYVIKKESHFKVRKIKKSYIKLYILCIVCNCVI